MDAYLYTLSGFAVGAIVGLTGVGGGSLMTPLLVLVFGVHPATAVGTDLLYAALTKAGGTVAHQQKGHIDWRITRNLALGSIPAAALTLWALSRLPRESDVIGEIISHGLGFALLLTAIAILFGRRLREYAGRREDRAIAQGADRVASYTSAMPALPSPPAPLPQAGEGRHIPTKGEGLSYRRHLGKITVLVGAALGVLVSLSSVGAGALGVAALFFLYPKLPTIRIVGSDVAHAVPLTLVAGLGHWLLGGVDWSLLGALLLGSLPGIWLGAQVSTKVPEHILRRLLAFMLVLIGGKLLAI